MGMICLKETILGIIAKDISPVLEINLELFYSVVLNTSRRCSNGPIEGEVKLLGSDVRESGDPR